MFLLVTTIIFWNLWPFENLSSSFVFSSENLLSSIAQCTWLHLYFPFRKFHSDIDNKMADNNGTALQHETNFDISKDRFCWTDIFIRWFEDYQLPNIAYGSNSFFFSLSTIIVISFNGVIVKVLYPLIALFFRIILWLWRFCNGFFFVIHS